MELRAVRDMAHALNNAEKPEQITGAWADYVRDLQSRVRARVKADGIKRKQAAHRG